MKVKRKNILVINGSLRNHSSTQIVITHVLDFFSKDVKFTLYPELEFLPAFNDPECAPEIITRFRKTIQDADAILICTPEYAFGVPGALKNALDWTVGSGEFTNKPVCIITAATSGAKAHAAILDIFNALSAKVQTGATLLIPFIRSKIKEGRIVDEETLNQLASVLNHFITSLL